MKSSPLASLYRVSHILDEEVCPDIFQLSEFLWKHVYQCDYTAETMIPPLLMSFNNVGLVVCDRGFHP